MSANEVRSSDATGVARAPKAAKVPLKLGLSGEGKWGDNGGPQYKAQCAITITPISGFDLPLSVTYVNRTPGVDRADLKGQLGINVDFAKLLKRPSPSLLGPN